MNVQIRLFVGLAVLSVATSGCMLTPYDGQRVSNHQSPIRFSGYHITPNARVDVFARDASGRWNQIGTAYSASSSYITSPDGYQLYYWEKNIAVPSSNWIGGVRGHRAVFRASSGGFDLYSVEEDGVGCYFSTSSLTEFAEKCSSPNTPIANVYTQDFSSSPAGGCYRFDNGTTQGWTLDQLYIADPLSVPQQKVRSAEPNPASGYYTYTPFTLGNNNNMLEASTGFYLITDPAIKLCDTFFESPDLSADPNWQGTGGYSVDVERTMYSFCGIPRGIFFVQLQVRVVEIATNQEKVFAETVGGTYQFHEMSTHGPQRFTWNDPVFSDPRYEVKQIRIRCTTPGYGVRLECAWRGGWKIGNVCPE